MQSFRLWFLLENARLNPAAYNSLFRSELEALLPRITDLRRRLSLEKMRDFDWSGYILAALRNAGFNDEREREEMAHEVITNLLVTPGNLFRGYDPEESGPIEARFKLAVMYEIQALRKRRAREAGRASRTLSINGDHERAKMSPNQIPDRRSSLLNYENDANLIAGFRRFVQQNAGDDVLAVLDRKLDGFSARQLYDEPAFQHLGKWGVEKAMRRIQTLAQEYAKLRNNDLLLSFITKVMREREARRQKRRQESDIDEADRVYGLIQRAGPEGISKSRLHKNSHLPIQELERALEQLSRESLVRIDLKDGERIVRTAESGLVKA
jgi:hypothetical protein